MAGVVAQIKTVIDVADLPPEFSATLRGHISGAGRGQPRQLPFVSGLARDSVSHPLRPLQVNRLRADHYRCRLR